MMTRSGMANLSKKIATHIIGAGVSLRSDSNDALVALATEETTQDSRWSDIHATFCTDPKERWNSDGEIRVHGESSYDRDTDEDGNVTSVMTVSVSVRWNGVTDHAPNEKLVERLALLGQMTELATQLQREYSGPITFMVRTAEDERVRVAKEEAENKRRKVQRMGEYPSKGLRAGGNSRSVSRELFTGCEDGVYEVSYDEGRRNVRITLRPGNATIRRTA